MGFTTEDGYFVLNGDPDLPMNRKPSTEVECWTWKIYNCCCRSFRWLVIMFVLHIYGGVLIFHYDRCICRCLAINSSFNPWLVL